MKHISSFWASLFVVLLCHASTLAGKKGRHPFNKHVSKRQQVVQPVAGGGLLLQASPLTAATRENDSPTDKNECDEAMDLLLVFDASHSITPIGFALMKHRALDLVNQLRISPDGTHVAVLKYSTTISTFFMFEENAVKDKTRRQINALTFDNGWSRLDLALQGVVDHVFHPAAGARENVPKVVVVFTDGKVVGPREPDRIVDWRKLLAHPVDLLRNQNVILFAVSLEENPDRNDFVNLDLIAGDRARVFTLAKLNSLVESLKRTAKPVCPASSSPSSSMPQPTPSLTISPTLSANETSSTQAASSSASVPSSGICPSMTSTCKPTSTCYPVGVTPCVHVYLVKVCNTFINTQCKASPTSPPTPTTRVIPTSTPPATATPPRPVCAPGMLCPPVQEPIQNASPPLVKEPCPFPPGPVQNVSPPRGKEPCVSPPVVEPPPPMPNVTSPCPLEQCPPSAAQGQGQVPTQGQTQALPPQSQAPLQAQGQPQAPVQAPAQAPATMQAPSPVQAPMQAPSPVQAPVQAPSPVQEPSPVQAPMQAPAPAPTQAQSPSPAQGPTSPCPDTNVSPPDACLPSAPTPAQYPPPASPNEYPTPAQVPYEVPSPAQVPTPSPYPVPAPLPVPEPTQAPPPEPVPAPVQAPEPSQAPPPVQQ